MSLPRLTVALRAFSSVTANPSETASDRDVGLLGKEQRRAERQAGQELSWMTLSKKIQSHCGHHKSEAARLLHELIHITREIVGSDAPTPLVESTAVFLFTKLKDCDTLTHQDIASLHETIGPFETAASYRALKVVQSILSLLPVDVKDDLDELVAETHTGEQEFGRHIHFSYESRNLDPADYSSDSDDECDEPVLKFGYNAAEVPSCGSAPVIVSGAVGTYKTPSINIGWLRKQVKDQFGESGTPMGMSIDALCEKLLRDLTSAKTNDELQNELFDLLGFECFELIEKLLTNRSQLIQAASHNHMSQIIAESKKDRQPRPIYGSQVTIQSEQEKELNKQLRKEEKRLSKQEGRGNSAPGMAGNEPFFDPQYLRMQRERALLDASRAPILTKRTSGAPKAVYPHVYDALAEAQKTSAFVGGAKVMLPEGFERKNVKMFEELRIPPSQPAPTTIGHHRVPISELDEIGQIAFKGTRNLNHIQSVVFETAYYSNENLLICAPTGAGKTNIAMLTVLHELKQHIDQGVIKKDEFKIVYVAPMKALAAEMVRNFGGRLAPLGIAVRELTGDMQLTKTEISRTQMLVTTPEKWDVVTRKSTGDIALTQLVKLLIIDEVHLLHEDRGAVIESLVARTLRQVESSQRMIRIVGLSATLPNYIDVARFLNVNAYNGLFFFDGRFRPVPLGQTYIGVKATNVMQQRSDMDYVCFEKVREMVVKGHQVMVFVHARNATVKTAQSLLDIAKSQGDSALFRPDQNPAFGSALNQVSKSRNKQLRELFQHGFSIHHAGMLRQDRTMVERCFRDGHIKVLVCTATLAWGVNLPAHAVIIKGTQLYDANKGAFRDLGILDVMQIFGRAGRPQYDTHGEGFIITTHDKLTHYLALMMRQNPIESQFIENLEDNLNAEIALGTVSNVEEAVRWLSYTYLYVRMHLNPLAYGINYKRKEDDPGLENYRNELVIKAGRALDKARMIRFNEATGDFNSTDLGRIASHFYIKYVTIETFNDLLKPLMTEERVFSMVSQAKEFQQIKVRDDELSELEQHCEDTCQMPAAGGVENAHGKVNILLQTYISRGMVESFSLVSDLAYVAQNSARIIRALFEITLRSGWPLMAARLLTLSKMVDRRLWSFESPLRQFPQLSHQIQRKLEQRNLTIDRLREMPASEIGHLIQHVRMGDKVKQCVNQLPNIELEATIQPITRTILRVRLTITPAFHWSDRTHGTASESWWIWVEDPDNNHIYHSEYFLLHKKQVISQEAQNLVFTIPIFDPLPSQYYIKAVSDRWLGSETVFPISFQHLILPEKHPPHTPLLDLTPLPITALCRPEYEALYKFTHFNPIQTQIFHTLYHTNHNVLLGAPTGSGKTIAAEIAMFKVFNEQPGMKVVYIAPLKALVRERISDWKVRLQQKLGKSVIELTGDVMPDIRAIGGADVIVTTPEKWDGVSRSWQTRKYVKAVSLLVIDEIHLLGDERGPVLEVIVSRTNFISSHTEQPLRVIGLSTALANARDLADWLGIKQNGLFNFRPSVRPVPLEVHIQGFPGKHYCPRMATMNKPAFQAIRTHSPTKPTLIFVSSRRQTRLTALELIAYLAVEDDPKQWLHIGEAEMANLIDGIKDTNLKLCLAFGIGLHHAGLHERDRRTVEELFVNQKIQLLIATSTLAWGVNFPAHLVIVKGTEFFDGKTKRYTDFPITDVLQMMGRAGRPQFDDQGTAVIFVHDIKKHFYKKFLYEPFPVESNLLDVLAEHLNAEIVAGTISSKQDAMDYITWTYFFRRLVMNPSYYKLEETDHTSINKFLSHLVERSLIELENCYCLAIMEDNRSIEPMTLGRICSFYYLHHQSVRIFRDSLGPDVTLPELVGIMSDAHEYEMLPVRHNEDGINSELAKKLPLEVSSHSFDSPHTKTHLLLQAHYERQPLPSSDYNTDLKSVLDQSIRIMQAMIDVSADQGWLATALRIMNLVQMTLQGRWLHENTLLTLPHVEHNILHCFKPPSKGKKANPIQSLPELLNVCRGRSCVLRNMVMPEVSEFEFEEMWKVLEHLPAIQTKLRVRGWWSDGGEEEDRPLPKTYITGLPKDEDYLAVHADQEYVLQVDLRRLNRRQTDTKCHAPRFPKSKHEGWFIVLGDLESRELLALKRIGYVSSRKVVQLAFYTPETTGRVIYALYIMSDCYLGLDQQYSVCLDVQEADINAQFNTEVTLEDGELDQLVEHYNEQT